MFLRYCANLSKYLLTYVLRYTSLDTTKLINSSIIIYVSLFVTYTNFTTLILNFYRDPNLLFVLPDFTFKNSKIRIWF